MTAQEVIKNCEINGNQVKLPPQQLDRKLYQEVAKLLNMAGGVWKSGKIQAFLFQEDPTEALEILVSGGKVNPKKSFQFFGTPSALADRLVTYADINSYDTVLEPQAGQGAIVKAIQRRCPGIQVKGCELMSLNRKFLTANIADFELIGDDFLLLDKSIKFTRIVANPPFTKNADIDHTLKAYEHLEEGGRLATITSRHWQISSNRKESEFRDFLEKVGAEIIEVDAGEFKESGTAISSLILIIDKK